MERGGEIDWRVRTSRVLAVAFYAVDGVRVLHHVSGCASADATLDRGSRYNSLLFHL